MDSESDLKRALGIQDSLWLGQIEIDHRQRELGVGSDAMVYRAMFDGRHVAAKVLHSILISPRNHGRGEFLRKFGEECRTLRQLSHPAIVSFIGVGQAPNRSPCLILELMEDSLASRIAATPPDTFLQTLSYLLDVASGLRYLHWKSIIHRDLKPQNILIVAGSAKISDVGLSRCLREEGQRVQQLMTRCPGTIYYMAPESLDEGVSYGVALDIFAMGVIVLTMFTNKEPAPQPRQLRILNNGQHNTTSELERRAGDLGKLDKDHPARPLVLDCLQETPDSRPSAVELHQALLDIQQKYTGTDRLVLQSELAAIQAVAASQREAYLRDIATLRDANQRDVESLRKAFQESQLHSQRQVARLHAEIEAQRLQIQELTTTAQQHTGAAQLAEQVFVEAPAAVFPYVREPPLPARFIRDVIAKRKWLPLDIPSSIRGKNARNPTMPCVYLNELYIAFNFTGSVRLFKSSTTKTWTDLPLPPDISDCMALVSDNSKLYMVFTKRSGNKTYAARLDAAAWTVSMASHLQEAWSGVVLHAGALQLIGGKTLDEPCVKRSTSLTADLHQWSTTQESTVGQASSILPAAPVAVSDHTITVCQDTMYITGGYTDDVNDTLPVYRLHSNDSQLTWKKSTLPETPSRVGCVAYKNYLWLAGGWKPSKSRALRDAYCLQPSTNEVVALPSLPAPRNNVRMVVFDGKLIVCGGYQDRKWHSDIFTLDVSP